MNPRERMLTVLDHREPDRVPLTASLCLDLKIKLRNHYRVNNDEETFQKLGIDFFRSGVGISPPKKWKPTVEFLNLCKGMGRESNLEYEYTIFKEWGIERKLGQTIPGSAFRNFYFTNHPWEHFNEVSQVEEAELPDLDAPGRFDTAIKQLKDYGDVRFINACINNCQWTRAWMLRGFMKFMKDLHTNPKMAEAILDKLNDYYIDMADRLLDLGTMGLYIAEDWGSNKSLFINPKMWRNIFKPRYKSLFNRAKKHNGFVFFHSDGNITPIVGDLVDIGVDSLNPIQEDCMNPFEIKKKYGDKLTLDCGMSVQKTLPYGTVEDVKKESSHALMHLAPGGGFIYGTSNVAQFDVPLENIISLYDTCKKKGEYPINIEL